MRSQAFNAQRMNKQLTYDYDGGMMIVNPMANNKLSKVFITPMYNIFNSPTFLTLPKAKKRPNGQRKEQA